MGMICYIW